MTLQKPNDDNRKILTEVSRSIAQSVSDLVGQAEIIKGQSEDLVGIYYLRFHYYPKFT